MRTKVNLFMILFALSFAAYALAAEGAEQSDSMGEMKRHMQAETLPAVEAGNKVCPVSGEEIGGAMGPGAQYEYQGRIYNFCCTGCIEEFKKDPEKYIEIIEKEIGEQGSHEEHDHMMGENNEQMMMGMDKEHSMMEHHQESSMANKANIKEINLEAYQFAFSPETITVNKGDIVKIHATSRDVPHGVFIKEYGINEKVEKGKAADIEFVADKTGEFDILCSVYCGRGHQNMKAKLDVKK